MVQPLLDRGKVLQRVVRDLLVVVGGPAFSLLASRAQGPEYLQIQDALAVAAVRPFDAAVLHRPTRLDEYELDALRLGPLGQGGGDELGAVVAPQPGGMAAPGSDPPPRPAHPGGRQIHIDLDVQPFAVEVVDDVYGAEPPLAAQSMAPARPPRRPAADSGPADTSAPLPAVASRLALHFSDDVLERRGHPRQLGLRPLEPGVLLFEVHQAPEVGRRHAAARRLPDVAGHFGDADLTAHLPGLMSAFHLLQRLDDPPLREPALAYWRPPGRSLHGDLQFCLDPLYGEARP